MHAAGSPRAFSWHFLGFTASPCCVVRRLPPFLAVHQHSLTESGPSSMPACLPACVPALLGNAGTFTARIGLRLTELDLDALFLEIDINEDGRIDFLELLGWLTASPHLAARTGSSAAAKGRDGGGGSTVETPGWRATPAGETSILRVTEVPVQHTMYMKPPGSAGSNSVNASDHFEGIAGIHFAKLPIVQPIAYGSRPRTAELVSKMPAGACGNMCLSFPPTFRLPLLPPASRSVHFRCCGPSAHARPSQWTDTCSLPPPFFRAFFPSVVRSKALSLHCACTRVVSKTVPFLAVRLACSPCGPARQPAAAVRRGGPPPDRARSRLGDAGAVPADHPVGPRHHLRRRQRLADGRRRRHQPAGGGVAAQQVSKALSFLVLPLELCLRQRPPLPSVCPCSLALVEFWDKVDERDYEQADLIECVVRHCLRSCFH
eukprot:SAG22_NODE_2007_length_3152_cov_3.209630_4_plen_432_part_00